MSWIRNVWRDSPAAEGGGPSRQSGRLLGACALIVALAFVITSPQGPALGTLGAVPLPAPHDALAQIRNLDYLLGESRGRYRLLVAEPFESENIWRPRAASNPLADVRYIYRTPEGRAFDREKALLESHTRARFQQSLFVHTSFEAPGRESFWIRPDRPIVLEGQLVRASLWVHSKGYLHTLTLLFENADGRRVPVNVGGLYWHGWKRVEVTLPPELFRRGRRATRRYRHLLTGMLITSHPLSEPGDVALMIDHLLVVSDGSEFLYPGFEYRDEW